MDAKKPCDCEKGGTMPKKENALSRTTSTSLGRVSAQRTRAVTSAMGVPTMTSIAAKVAADTLASNIVGTEAKLAKLWESAKANESPVRKAGVDGLGALTGVVSFEGINWMVRYIGDKWAYVGENVDYFQSIPHLVLGIVVYWGELVTRRKGTKDGPPIFASFPREVASEWAKVFMLLGTTNLLRAMRVRRSDAKKAAENHTAALAELAKVKAELDKLKA